MPPLRSRPVRASAPVLRRGLARAVSVVGRSAIFGALAWRSLAAQSAAPMSATSTPPGLNLIQPADARADLHQLLQALNEAHGAPYRFVTKAQVEQRVAAYQASIAKPVTQFELLGLVSRVLADIGDGHARAALDSATARRFAIVPMFPLRVRIEDGGRLMVVGNDALSDSVISPGDEVLQINGKSTGEILRTLAPLVPHDGFIASGRDARLSRAFPSQYHQFIDQRTEFDVTVRAVSGATHRVHVVGISDSVRALTRHPNNARFLSNVASLDGAKENISVRFPGDGSVGVLRVRGFGGDRFEAELDSVMTLALDRGAGSMVLDLRGNGGGVDLYGANLVGRFTEKPFRYFDHIHISTLRPSFTTFLPRTYAMMDSGTTPDPAGGWLVLPRLHRGVVEQSPAARPFRGPLVVLMDGGTFSTAADVTATLRGLGRATFIGEESGGAYEGNTSGSSALLYLNHSGIRVSVQMYGYVNAAPPPRERGRGTLPDITLPLRTSDIVQGQDPAMRRALEVASGASRR